MDLGILELTAAAIILFALIIILTTLEMRRTKQGKKTFDTSTIFLLIETEQHPRSSTSFFFMKPRFYSQ